MAKAGLKFPRKLIIPGAGDVVPFRHDCDEGAMSFRLHVRPEGLSCTSARIVELVCCNCGKVFKVDDEGRVEAPGRIESNRDPKLGQMRID